MEWSTIHHLDLRHVGWEGKPLQPHAAAFHPNHPLIVVAVGKYIIEFDAINGSKISTVDIGSPVVRMSYSPEGGHAVVAILEDCTLRLCDFDSEQSFVLHSPERKMERISSDTEVHLALTPLHPIAFYGFHRKMSVTVVGTMEGGRVPTKIKTDLKRPVVNLACHPRLPVLYVAYADGFIRAYSIHTFAVLYTLQLDSTIKLLGAAAFAFHPTLEWVFVGDRRGTLLAWDVSTERPYLVGITQVGSQPIISVSWLPMFRLLTTLTKDGVLQVWKTRAGQNPYQPSTQVNFFERAAIESIDIPRILSQKGGEETYPLPHVRAMEVHPKLNMAALLFANVASTDNVKNRAAFAREGRKQLFAVLQSARGSSASVLKEKLAALGSSGILADHQLQAQLQEHHLKGQNQVSITDTARKAFLYSHFLEGHAKSAPISQLPLITIVDTRNRLRDLPICQPLHLELNFFNKQNRVLHYPTRAFYIEGENLMAYNLCSGVESIYKKLYASVPAHVEYCPRNIVYSRKQHLFLVTYEFIGVASEVVLYHQNTDSQLSDAKSSTIKGRDAAFIGPSENHFSILEDDKIGLLLYILPGPNPKELDEKNAAALENPTAYMENPTADSAAAAGGIAEKGPIQFMFETEVDRIFSTPLDSTLMFASHGSQISFAKFVQGYHLSSDGHYIPTTSEGRKSIKLKVDEIVLQVQWQETLRGFTAGVMTTHRVLIVSASLEILASSSTKFDKGTPAFRSLLWVGPALLFSSATVVSVLGWDGKVRTILSVSTPNAVLLGAVNDRLLFAVPTQIQPRQKKGTEIKSFLVGLLEPLLIGYATMQQYFEQKLGLPETLYQITSRFDSLRITPRSLDVLTGGSPVCGDLAVALSQAGPQFTQVERGIYAIKGLRFSTALSSLKDRFMHSRDYPHCLPTSPLFQQFRHLAYACIKYGQFDSAKETFEVVADYESMLDLFICHLNPSAMRRLAQELEQDGSSPELRRYCERILGVRSTGWTQGLFSNFAAESMVPKGPEWGGANWEIKTRTNMKGTPHWALAADVMPYMRTDDGPIPSIVADRIGVHLGCIKGRGNVVEVREDSLIKAYKPANSDSKTNVAPVLPADAMADIKADPLMGLEMLTSSKAPSSSAEDKQAKAAEEFKRSLYGDAAAGDSSSDEEGEPKNKKFQIRILDKHASPSVDVNKIKEATRQISVGPTVGRTKSLTELQDAALMFPKTTQSAPKTGITPSVSSGNLFSLGSFGQTPSFSPPPVVKGAAVTAGPIPEDFFQNTISSVQIAAALPPPGAVISRLNPQPRRVEMTSQDSSSADAAQETRMHSVQVDSIGLPDGGVPPQATGQPSVKPHDQIQAAPLQTSSSQTLPLQISSESLDVSLLQPSSSTDAGKSAIQKNQHEVESVRPGQVPQGAPASVCFKTGLVHLEQNLLHDALSCFNEGFLALAKDLSRGSDIKAQATICAQYKIAVALLQETGQLQRVYGAGAVSAKDEMARLSRHLGSLPLLAKHRISCIRTAIQYNMKVHNYAYSKQMLDLLLSKAPPNKRDELRSLIELCVQRGLTNKSINPREDPSQFCAATLGHLSTIGYDMCDLCGAKFSALAAPGCIICGMGGIKRSDALAGKGPVPSPFG